MANHSWKDRKDRLLAKALEVPAPRSSTNGTRRPVERDAQGRIKAGTTLNPGGRIKGLSQRIRELTNDGEKILRLLADMVEGKVKANPRDQLEAGKILLERGFGKVADVRIELDGAGAATAELTDEALTALLQTVKRAEKAAPLAILNPPTQAKVG